MKCTYHPDVDTNITCSNCDKPICPKDMVYTAVGIKCPQCARPVGRMTAHGKPRDYAMATLVGIALAVGGGIALGEVRAFLRIGEFILTVAYGYLMGEASSWAARRNGGVVYQVIVGACTLVGLAISSLVSGSFLNPFFIVAAIFAVGLAVSRMGE